MGMQSGIEDIQFALCGMETIRWPDHIIDSVFCELWSDCGRWVIEVRRKLGEDASQAEQVAAALFDGSVYEFCWPSPHANAQEAYNAACAYRPTHPEVQK